jgi:hypothetical protein
VNERRAQVTTAGSKTVALIIAVIALALACWYFFGYAR